VSGGAAGYMLEGLKKEPTADAEPMGRPA